MRNFVKSVFLFMTALLPTALTAADATFPREVILPLEVVYTCNAKWGEGFDHFKLAMGGSGPTDRDQVTITADDGAVFNGSYSAHIIADHTRLEGATAWHIGAEGDGLGNSGVLTLSLIGGAYLFGNGEINLNGHSKTILVDCESI